MRKSSLYLGLSIIALIAGIAMGEAKDWRASCGGSCPLTGDAKPSPDLLEHHVDEAFRMVQTGDHEAMEFHAGEILKTIDAPITHALLAYAWRGQERHEESIRKYREVIRRAEQQASRHGSCGERSLSGLRPAQELIADCWIGIAANFAALGQAEAALEAADKAVELARERVQNESGKDAHYQLACAYATRSGISENPGPDRGAAIAHLKLAITQGFDNFAHMRGDLDLKPLHGDERFEALVD